MNGILVGIQHDGTVVDFDHLVACADSWPPGPHGELGVTLDEFRLFVLRFVAVGGFGWADLGRGSMERVPVTTTQPACC